MKTYIRKILKLFFFLFMICSSQGGNVLELLKNRATHSQFAELLGSTDGVHKYYMNGYVTVFAPSNAALDQYTGDKNAALILNHIASAYPRSNLQTVNAAVSEEQLIERLTSLLQGHPPLWVRRKGDGLYVNHAKVSMVLPVITESGKKQFLYLIDSVLEPLIPKDESNIAEYVDIKSGDILNNTDKFMIGGFSIDKFAEQVSNLGVHKFPEYSSYGRFTFFIPVDQAFTGLDKRLVDEEVVRSHIVPGNLLFSKPSLKQGQETELLHTVQYKQASMEVKVVVSVFEGEDGRVKVQSQTMTGNRNHPRGKVVASIVKGNIPVQNGVVHLIDRPLVILASTLWEMLDPSKPENKRFSKFSNLLVQNPDLLERIKAVQSDDADDTKNGATLFVPTNAAFDELSNAGLSNVLIDNPDLMGFHFLDHILETTDIRISQPQNSWGMFGCRTGFPQETKDKVWLWNSDDETVYVDGGGVEAAIVDGNIRATNGIIHQVDKVLGVPLSTVLDKIKSDPMLKKTFALGEQEHFNSRLGEVDTNFTFIIPSDQAWEEVRQKYSTAYKVLFLGQFFYQVHHILERHLKIGEKLSLEDIMAKGSLGTLRGTPLSFYKDTVDGEEFVMVSHEDIEARVVRPNLECSNGYIHIIDRVIMKRRDVTLSGCLINLPSSLAVSLALLIGLLVK